MGISIGIRNFEYPEWVERIYEKMTDEERANSVKTGIYSSCMPIDKNQYEINPFIAGMSNRITSGLDVEGCAGAIAITDNMYPWHFLQGNKTQLWQCKHCGYKFTTREKDPRCEFCRKWNWEEINNSQSQIENQAATAASGIKENGIT